MQLSKLCLATKKFLSAMVITTTVLSTTPIQKINLKGSEINVSALNYNLRFWFAKLNSWEPILDKYKCYQLRF